MSINKELFKVEYLIKLSQYFGNLAKAVMRSHNKAFFRKVSKILVEFNKAFDFEKYFIYVSTKIYLKPHMHLLLFIFLVRKSNPKCLQL